MHWLFLLRRSPDAWLAKVATRACRPSRNAFGKSAARPNSLSYSGMALPAGSFNSEPRWLGGSQHFEKDKEHVNQADRRIPNRRRLRGSLFGWALRLVWRDFGP